MAPKEVPLLVRVHEARSVARPRVDDVADAYNERGQLRPEFLDTDLEAKLMVLQRKLALDAVNKLSSKKYPIPKNVHVFVAQGFAWNQIAHEKPWAVYVLRDGKRKRLRFNNLREAIIFHKKCYKQGLSCGIVSLCRAYALPEDLRFKKDKYPDRFKWCPNCAEFRVFTRVRPEAFFFSLIKTWDDKDQRFIFPERKIYVMECQLCGNTNRSEHYRRANQPYEVRTIKPRKTRVKAHSDTKALRASRARAARGRGI